MYTVRLYPKRDLGPIRDLHGVGGGPVGNNFTYDATEDYREAGIPFCRTHDIEYPLGAGEYVDIHCIFRDFDKDENDPASYNFTFTDEYLKSIEASGAKTFYRMGSTIEHQPVKLYIKPPKDPAKWGRICAHIISHYNEGWADGFHMGIEYWEFWNEPEIAPCWTGTQEEFLDFYAAAAPEIKKAHPTVKLGGCAFCSPVGPLQEKFLARVRDDKLPLDFYSWHGYLHDPRKAKQLAFDAEAILEKYGLGGTESIYDEWNYVVSFQENIEACYDLHHRAFMCSFMAAVMSSLQDSPVDKSMYYDAQMIAAESWNGVFTYAPAGLHAAMRRPKRLPGYYALYTWNELKKLGTQIGAESDCGDLFLTAAKNDRGETGLLLSYFNDDALYNSAPPAPAEFRIGMPGMKAEVRIIDEGRTFEPAEAPGGVLRMEGNSAAFIRYTSEI